MLSCVDQLPEEPPKTKEGITNILFRFPDGGRESRRFNGEDKVKVYLLSQLNVARLNIVTVKYRCGRNCLLFNLVYGRYCILILDLRHSRQVP